MSDTDLRSYSLFVDFFFFQIKKTIRAQIYADKIKLGLLHQKVGHIDYGLGKNTLLMKVTDKTMRSWKNQR